VSEKAFREGVTRPSLALYNDIGTRLPAQ